MIDKPRGRFLNIAAVLFAILAVSNLLKPIKILGENTGFVLLGQRLDGTANLIAGPLFGLYLLIYALSIWRRKRIAVPMAYAYAVYVLVNVVLFISYQPASSGAGHLIFGLVYSVVAVGVSSGTALLLKKSRATLS